MFCSSQGDLRYRGWEPSPELPWSSLRNTEGSIQISCLPTAAGCGHLPTEKLYGKREKYLFLPHNLARRKYVNKDGEKKIALVSKSSC